MKTIFFCILMQASCAPAFAMTLFRDKPPVEHHDVSPVTPSPTPAPSPTPKPPVADSAALVARIKSLAGSSTCARYSWKDRGRAPVGYIKGSALAYARAYCQSDSSLQRTISQPVGGEKDMLNRYAKILKEGGHSIQDSDDRLRTMYTFMIGLGMRESSGKYCCGRDASMDFTSADTAESGLMQTSWNARVVSAELPQLWTAYTKGARSCLLDTFQEGVSSEYCAKQTKNWGDPKATGFEFQRVHKNCPALSLEFAAVVTRFSGGAKSHYGPIRQYKVEIRKECADMLKKVEDLVEENPTVCLAF